CRPVGVSTIAVVCLSGEAEAEGESRPEDGEDRHRLSGAARRVLQAPDQAAADEPGGSVLRGQGVRGQKPGAQARARQLRLERGAGHRRGRPPSMADQHAKVRASVVLPAPAHPGAQRSYPSGGPVRLRFVGVGKASGGLEGEPSVRR
ncbi:unnamed protein product, partial [Ectocarpus fasciculatus]